VPERPSSKITTVANVTTVVTVTASVHAFTIMVTNIPREGDHPHRCAVCATQPGSLAAKEHVRMDRLCAGLACYCLPAFLVVHVSVRIKGRRKGPAKPHPSQQMVASLKSAEVASLTSAEVASRTSAEVTTPKAAEVACDHQKRTAKLHGILEVTQTGFVALPQATLMPQCNTALCRWHWMLFPCDSLTRRR
jgi:hypothetical protein